MFRSPAKTGSSTSSRILLKLLAFWCFNLPSSHPALCISEMGLENLSVKTMLAMVTSVAYRTCTGVDGIGFFLLVCKTIHTIGYFLSLYVRRFETSSPSYKV